MFHGVSFSLQCGSRGPRQLAASVPALKRRRRCSLQVQTEDATFSGYVADMDLTTTRLGGLEANGQSEPHAAPVRASLLEGSEELLGFPGREAAAFVLDVEHHAVAVGLHTQ